MHCGDPASRQTNHHADAGEKYLIDGYQGESDLFFQPTEISILRKQEPSGAIKSPSQDGQQPYQQKSRDLAVAPNAQYQKNHLSS